MIKLEMKTFASLREDLGEHIHIDVQEDWLVQDVIEALKRTYPERAPLLHSSRIASLDTILDRRQSIQGHKALLLLPPSSGG